MGRPKIYAVIRGSQVIRGCMTTSLGQAEEADPAGQAEEADLAGQAEEAGVVT